ncbi:MAG: helix-turn-helix domain-containing protein [Anaerolineales bacterium]|nr:helix-turn-helix domain-containing protein [Anaerolineales bacterium]
MAIYNRLKILIAEKELRENRKLPYRVIAQEIGVSTSTITQYVTQKVTRFDVPTLEAFCMYFECQPGDLLIWDKNDPWVKAMLADTIEQHPDDKL